MGAIQFIEIQIIQTNHCLTFVLHVEYQYINTDYALNVTRITCAKQLWNTMEKQIMEIHFIKITNIQIRHYLICVPDVGNQYTNMEHV